MDNRKILKILLIGVLATAFYQGVSGLTSAVFLGLLPADTALQIVDIAISTILSTALVILYFQQKQVMESQEELKRAELSGDLYVNDYSFDGKEI